MQSFVHCLLCTRLNLQEGTLDETLAWVTRTHVTVRPSPDIKAGLRFSFNANNLNYSIIGRNLEVWIHW